MRRRRTTAAWRELIEGFAASGQTVAGYCAEQGICRASFYRWRALLGGGTGPRLPASAPRAAIPRGAMPFVDLGALREPRSRLELRLDLGDGLVLQISRG